MRLAPAAEALPRQHDVAVVEQHFGQVPRLLGKAGLAVFEPKLASHLVREKHQLGRAGRQLRVIASDHHHAVEPSHPGAVERQDRDARLALRRGLLVSHRFEQCRQHRAKLLLVQRGVAAGLVVGQVAQLRQRIEQLPPGIVGSQRGTHIERVEHGVEAAQPDMERLLREAARPLRGLVGQRGDQRASRSANLQFGIAGLHRLRVDQRACRSLALCKQMRQSGPASGNDSATDAALHQRDRRAAMLECRQAKRALEQVEQRRAIAIARQHVKPAHQRGGSARGRQLPAGFIADRRSGTRQQRAGAAATTRSWATSATCLRPSLSHCTSWSAAAAASSSKRALPITRTRGRSAGNSAGNATGKASGAADGSSALLPPSRRASGHSASSVRYQSGSPRFRCAGPVVADLERRHEFAGLLEESGFDRFRRCRANPDHRPRNLLRQALQRRRAPEADRPAPTAFARRPARSAPPARESVRTGAHKYVAARLAGAPPGHRYRRAVEIIVSADRSVLQPARAQFVADR
jgi:hypothetical protein